MAARLGLDSRVWQLCQGVNKKGEKTTFFQNLISKKSFTILPPDEFDKTYSDEELKCSVPNHANGLNRYFPKVIEKESLDVDVVHEEELDVLTPALTDFPDPTSDTEEATIDTTEEEEKQLFARDEMFHQSDPRYKLKPDLLNKCVEQGIPHHYLEDGNGKKKGQVMIVPDIWMMVDKFYLEWHKRDGTAAHDSLCFQVEVQTIERKRKHTSTQQKKDEFEDNIRKAGKLFLKAKSPLKKSVLAPAHVLRLFSGQGFYITGTDIRCPCTNKVISGDHADQRSYERHVSGKKHQKHIEIKTVTQEQQARLVSTTPVDGHLPRMELEGTRNTSVSVDDYALRRRVLRMFLGAGIPLYVLDRVRTAMEDISKKSLEGRSAVVSNHLKSILDAELELQIEELKGKKISLCFDGTPRLGDVFAMVARYVEVRDGKVNSRQRLIHIAFANKSMNGPNVCAEVSRGLQGKRLVHQDVVSMAVDGCSVNIAAHAAIEKDYDIVWMLCLCLSHSTNNGGDEASFVILHQFWTLIQKCFSQSENAKIIWEKHTGR
jgi:hypothetical protein